MLKLKDVNVVNTEELDKVSEEIRDIIKNKDIFFFID